MSDRDHAEAALDQLQRLDRTDLTDEQRSAHADAVAAVETLCQELEATADQSRPDPDTPEEWDEDDWDDQLEAAREKAAIPPSKGTLTTKTINERDYYYLQWREGDTVTSQYVGPVDPA